MSEFRSRNRSVSILELNPAVGTSAYATGDFIGAAAAPMKFAQPFGAHEQRGLAGLIEAVTIIDNSAQAPAMDLIFFDTLPSGTTFTDNAALDIADADMNKIVGVLEIVAGDWVSFADNSIVQKRNLQLPVVMADQREALYAALVSRGSPTFVAATDVIVRVHVLPLV